VPIIVRPQSEVQTAPFSAEIHQKVTSNATTVSLEDQDGEDPLRRQS